MIKRILRYAFLIILIYMIQAVLLGQFEFLKAKPDVLLVLIIAAAFFSDGPEGIYIGLSIGVFKDFVMTDTFGFYTILSIFAVFLTVSFNKRIFKDNVVLFALIVLAVSALNEILASLLHMIHDFISGSGSMNFMGYIYFFKTYSAPAVLMNFLISFVMFYIIKMMFFRKSDITRGYA